MGRFFTPEQRGKSYQEIRKNTKLLQKNGSAILIHVWVLFNVQVYDLVIPGKSEREWGRWKSSRTLRSWGASQESADTSVCTISRSLTPESVSDWLEVSAACKHGS